MRKPTILIEPNTSLQGDLESRPNEAETAPADDATNLIVIVPPVIVPPPAVSTSAQLGGPPPLPALDAGGLEAVCSSQVIQIEPEADALSHHVPPMLDGEAVPTSASKRSQQLKLFTPGLGTSTSREDKARRTPASSKQAMSHARLRHAGPGPMRSVAVACKVTVLTSTTSEMRKTFRLDESGVVNGVAGANATYYRFAQVSVSGIVELGALIERHSQDPRMIIIRGEPVPGLIGSVRRSGANFPEPPEGCLWVMLDFDNVTVLEGMNPNSTDAIEYLIAKLPAPFKDASYFFQFSSSAGIRKGDGSPYKTGINVHIFFYFSRPVPGEVLTAYLILHCIETGFYKKEFRSDGLASIVFGIDPAVIRSSVQPHFVALPSIGAGVHCDLTPERRQGLVRKGCDAIDLGAIPQSVVHEAFAGRHQLLHEWKRECGQVRKTIYSRTLNGSVSATVYYANPDPAAIRTGRRLVSVEIKEIPTSDEGSIKLARLYFVGESSPGSWYVFDRSPALARRFGDGTTVALKELSPEAHDYVRDKLKWFQEVVVKELTLTHEGYLPAFDTFMTAKFSLLLAPTGSGKTTAFCNFALAQRNQTIIYAAQTIALTLQMQADLKNANMPVIHYADFDKYAEMRVGVYVTTNMSLPKIVDTAKRQGKAFIFVIDEVHVALDDFMRLEATNRVLEDAMLRATRTIFMTGTMTTLQRQKLADTVSKTPGGLAIENFTCYEFAPVKSFPLIWARQANFGADLVALLRSYQKMKVRGEPIPRTVVIASTSAMKKFKLLLEHFGLIDDAMVVSRQEAKPSEIEAARVDTRPILISSPVFAIGLNFDCAPVRFWALFEFLSDLDTSQIIQTVNRANRTATPCEVRLYAGSMNNSMYPYVSEIDERQRLEEFFINESEIAGVIDPHFQLDRATYNEMRRQLEKNTSRSLAELYQSNAVQNYSIVEEWREDLPRDNGDADLYKNGKTSALAAYRADVITHVPPAGSQSLSMLACLLRLSRESRRAAALNDQAPKEITDRELGVLATLTGNPKHFTKSAAPDGATMLRLLAEIPPYIGSQYEAEKTTRGNEVRAQKVRDTIEVVVLLERLKTGAIDGVEFGKKMRQKLPRRGVLALAKGETDYVSWCKKLEAMDADQEKYVSATSFLRRKLNDRFFEAAQRFLKRIGVSFGKSKGRNGRQRRDSAKPEVPDWDFARVRLQLEVFAASLEARPRDLVSPWIESQKCKGGQVKLEVCAACAHCDLDTICLLGRTNQVSWDQGLDLPTEGNCEGFAALPARVRSMKTLWLHPENLQISCSESPLKSQGTLEVEGVVKVL